LKEYEKVIKTYETEEVKKCTCDKCGKECDISNKGEQKRTLVQISPQYIGDNRLYRDLCPECTKELINWFKQDEDTKDFIDVINIWETI
jgi:hypothetical protein